MNMSKRWHLRELDLELITVNIIYLQLLLQLNISWEKPELPDLNKAVRERKGVNPPCEIN